MKILQFMASDGYGGAEKVFVELSNAMAEHHDVTALLIRGCTFRERFSEQVKLIELKSNPTRHNPFLHYEIFSTLGRLKPDIIHTHAAKGAELIRKVNRLSGLPHLGTKHNDRKGRIFNSLKWVSAVSQKGKHSVRSKVNGTVRVIYNGVVETPVSERVQHDVFTMLAVGRLDSIKGFDVLIEKVSQLDFPFRLQIVGEGPEKEPLAARINELGLNDKVELPGFREDIAQLMHDCDLVVISSHREGGPKVMMEALYYAPALLTTPVGVVPEVMPKQFQSDIGELAERISTIYHNYDETVRAFAELRGKRKHDFEFDHIVKQYEAYYSEILRKR